MDVRLVRVILDSVFPATMVLLGRPSLVSSGAT